MSALAAAKQRIETNYYALEPKHVETLVSELNLTGAERSSISKKAAEFVEQVRKKSSPTLMDSFLAEYGLSTSEGVALMCLAEAMLRVPDAPTLDKLIEDKVASGQWRSHLGHSSSALVNSSTWALMLTGELMRPAETSGMAAALKLLLQRLGEPVVRLGVAQAMRELGRQFVLGQQIEDASDRAKKLEARGYTYSYDMLGEAALTAKDAKRYFEQYAHAIKVLSKECSHKEVRKNPGVSVKLSALHPRYEFAQRQRVLTELVPKVVELACMAADAGMGFNIDAEEADRLELSLEVIEAVLSHVELGDSRSNWQGFGVVVQAFGPRAPHVIDYLYELSLSLNRKLMVRLVKGAYWDTEIKHAQVEGLPGFAVFTQKAHSDISYMACAKKLLSYTERIYPQFATHNAHSMSAVLHMAKNLPASSYEFQRLHGMGQSLHETVHELSGVSSRIYAPVGRHRELLAYLVRRLLENGANSSFVNQIYNTQIPPERIAADPIKQAAEHGFAKAERISLPAQLYDKRANSQGMEIQRKAEVQPLLDQVLGWFEHSYQAAPLLAEHSGGFEAAQSVTNPANPSDVLGTQRFASSDNVSQAFESAKAGFNTWSQTSLEHRAKVLLECATKLEDNQAELFALLMREAGKTLKDCVAELREAVDFARYYAQQLKEASAPKTSERKFDLTRMSSRGTVVCISPWNFPLAIFSGQVFAALGGGNAVLAKPAEQTGLVAYRAVQLFHEAGVPKDVLQLVLGTGAKVGQALCTEPEVKGVCFTGSLPTARLINQSMAKHMALDTPLIAETGGLNAMIVDSTALPEQVVKDVVASAFQSAGQRCSALRILYVQDSVYSTILDMLVHAMDELSLGSPAKLSTDVGPVIDADALSKIKTHISKHEPKVLKSIAVPDTGHFAAPTLIEVSGVEQLEEEVFGPVLHVAKFKGNQIEAVVESINAKGYGLTFGIHSRMDSRVYELTRKVKVGNVYANRNQIGAVVGSQPFGGEGMSGTGPKAGGPSYLPRFFKDSEVQAAAPQQLAQGKPVELKQLQSALDTALKQLKNKPASSVPVALESLFAALNMTPPVLPDSARMLPGPTGETNRLTLHPRGLVLCIGPGLHTALKQAAMALATGNAAVVVAPKASMKLQGLEHMPLELIDGVVEPDALTHMSGVAAVFCASVAESHRPYRVALAERQGAVVPLIDEVHQPERYQLERHLCVDTTAAGGNASLISEAG